MNLKCRVFLAVGGAVMVAAVLLHPRTEPSVPTPDPAPQPANHPEEGMPGPNMASSVAHLEASHEHTGHTNLVERLLSGDGVKLTPEQISAFLAANHRSVESLLAAMDSIQSAEEAYRSAGYSEAETKLISSTGALLPQLAQLKQLSLSMVDLANSYRQAGDTASGQTVLDLAIHLGQQLDANGPGGQFLINNLVGMAIQLNALKAMDPASTYGSSGQTVQDYMDQILEQRAAFKQLGQQTESLWQTMPPQDLISFFDRQKLYGEPATLQSYLNKRGQLSGSAQN